MSLETKCISSPLGARLLLVRVLGRAFVVLLGVLLELVLCLFQVLFGVTLELARRLGGLRGVLALDDRGLFQVLRGVLLELPLRLSKGALRITPGDSARGLVGCLGDIALVVKAFRCADPCIESTAHKGLLSKRRAS